MFFNEDKETKINAFEQRLVFPGLTPKFRALV